MIKLLWVDDNLDQDLAEKRVNLLMQDDIESDFAGDASDAYYYLRDNTYDVVILDLRHPSGPDDMWQKQREEGEQKYGPVLLRTIKENQDGVFNHLKNTRYGVFTIETKDENPGLFEPPINLPEQHYKMKTHATDENDFVDFIRTLYQSR